MSADNNDQSEDIDEDIKRPLTNKKSSGGRTPKITAPTISFGARVPHAQPSIAAKGAGDAGKASMAFVALMASLGALNAFATDIVIPALSAIGDEYSLPDPNMRQWVILSLFLGMGLAQLIMGPLADGLGRRKTIMWCFGVYMAGCIVAIYAQSFEIFLAARFVQGFGSGGFRIASMAIMRDRYAGSEMARIVSLTSAVFIVMILAAPTIGQFLLSLGHWRWGLWFLVFQCLAIWIWFHKSQPETLTPEMRQPIHPRSILTRMGFVLSNRTVTAYTMAVGAIYGSFSNYLASAQQIFIDIYHVGIYLPLCFASLAGVFGLVSLTNAQLVMRLGARNIAWFGLWMSALSGMIGWLLFWLVFDGVPPLWLFMIWLLLPMSSFSLLYGNLQALALEPMGEHAGTASSVVAAFGTIAGVVVAGVAGAAFNNTVLPLSLAFGLCGIGGLLAMRITNKPRRMRD